MVLENEKLKRKYTKATNSLATLQEAITNLQNVSVIAQCAQQDPKTVYKIYRDSLIQRFEYTFDTTWKYIGEYLQANGHILIPKSPKTIFRECLKARILSAEDVRIAIEMTDDRNLTTHGYDEELVEEISKKIPAYAIIMQTVLQQTAMKESL